ncbi:MAG: cyanophycinase [Gemmatimonadaceae bacterium]|nr:cyanophycinase [Gemmatimonadaceae bacterium]NUQ92271.1 cyanophycinase [Gemmatimonadaceae bacterium]NUR20731.1 cyanophycinase [Gemmatimonadaceae bacterium]NUS95808.1 cyanophycinase [Gemmatimonadaceae bacterium]
MPRRRPGRLLIVGGHEDKENEKLILRALVDEIGEGGKLVVATVASQLPEDLWEDYERVFRGLGVRHLYKLQVDKRAEAKSEQKLRVLDDADAVFFTGGDQLKITSQIGDTPIYERIHEIFRGGGLIAGTSAGASVVCETMMVGGDGNGSNRIGVGLRMAPGFGLFKGAIVDQHFAERGRMGRLVGAVAQNPRILGVGIDENTAILVKGNRTFTVIGDGAVYVLDGSTVTYTNIAEERVEKTLSIYDVKMHVLTQGDTFDLSARRPHEHTGKDIDEELLPAGLQD